MNFHSKLAKWYLSHRRDLPWRNTQNPYYIWLSEVILQQTRVQQGLPYYVKFISNFPQISDLADAKEEQVLKLWQGLGYYSRARNLHFAAKQVINEFNGEFPSSYKDILSLKGVGEYTAAAIGSFAFGLPHPVIDGNVERVIARIFGITKPVNTKSGREEVSIALNEVFDKKDPATFNQAIMEFGSLQCTPQNPNCNDCIFQNSCIANSENLVTIIPVKEKKIKIKERYFYYFIIENKNTIYIQQRTENDIWKGLYQFPLIEVTTPIKDINTKSVKKIIHDWNLDFEIQKVSQPIKHILSHQRIHTHFIHLSSSSEKQTSWKKINKTKLHEYAFPQLIIKYITKDDLGS